MDNKENMGKDYFSKNNRVITNDEQFTAYVQKYNNKMEEEELRLLSSLGLTEEDIIDKTDPDLGTTRSAEAMLRSIDRQKKYREKIIQKARENKNKVSQPENNSVPSKAKYRCQQVNVTRLEGQFLTSTEQKFQFAVELDFNNSKADIKLEEHYFQTMPPTFSKVFDFVTLIEKIRNNVELKYDDNGKVAFILNKQQQLDMWNQLKTSPTIQNEFIKLLQEKNPEAYKNMILCGDKQFSIDYTNDVNEYQATLFYAIMFNKHLCWDKCQLDHLETQMFASALFEQVYFPLTLEYKVEDTQNNQVRILVSGHCVPSKDIQQNVEKLYSVNFQPIIEYSFTEYKVDYQLNYNFNKETRIVNEARLIVKEAVEYNVEHICEYKLHKI